MNVQTAEIERVVREVLAELAAAQAKTEPKVESGKRKAEDGERTAASGRSSSASKESNPQSPIPNPSAAHPHPGPLPAGEGTVVEGDLVVNARVVTMDEVAGRLASVRRLVVGRKAIVTPAVQDELLQRNIALVYADSSDKQTASPPRLVMICSGADFDTASLVAALGREGIKAESSTLDCLVASTEQLAAEMAKPNTLGVLLTPHTAAGLCLANRLRGVRAVMGVDPLAVATGAAAVGANLLAANPQTGGFFQLKQMVIEFCRGGARPCPEVFRKQLG